MTLMHSASSVLREDWIRFVEEGLDGFRAFELAAAEPRLPGNPRAWARLRKLREQHGLRYSVHAPFRNLDPASQSSALAKKTLALYRGAVDIAGEVGAELVVVHPASVTLAEWKGLSERERRAVRGREADAYRALASHAGEVGVLLGVENMPGYRAARDTTWLLELLRDVGSPWLRVTVDVGHAHTSGIAPALMLRELSHVLAHIHVHDNNGEADQHRAVGHGHIHWPSIVAEMVSQDFRGLVTDEALSLFAQRRGAGHLARLADLAGRVRWLERDPGKLDGTPVRRRKVAAKRKRPGDQARKR